MRTGVLSIWSLAVLLLLVCTAAATTIDTTDQIDIYGSPYAPSGAFQFHMTGSGDFTLALGNALGIITTKGSGTGLFATPTLQPVAILQNGTTITGAPVGTCSNTSGTSCTFDLTQTGGPLLFEYGNNGGLLTADLLLEDIVETDTTGGGVNDALLVNLTNLSGSFANDFSQDGVLQLVLLFNIRNPSKGKLIYSLAGEPTGVTVWASIGSGQVNPATGLDPSIGSEPASFAMLGVGLLGIAAFLRRSGKAGIRSKIRWL
jgi:hypothetical protein